MKIIQTNDKIYGVPGIGVPGIDVPGIDVPQNVNVFNQISFE